MGNKKDPHEEQWRQLRKVYADLSRSPDDIYDIRSKSCSRLLTSYCQT